jgi:hypothetical protein
VEGQVDESKAKQLMAECDTFGQTSMFYAMASSPTGAPTEFGDASSHMEFHAKSSWVLIRGHRYQVLEREFFEFALMPHDAALRKAYGIGAEEIAIGLQSIADAIRAGYSGAIAKVFERMAQSDALVKAEGISLEDAVKKMKTEDAGVAPELAGAFRDMFFGGICNLSRHTKLPEPLLADMAYQPGAEEAFYADGSFKGTPFRTLPARIRPLIKLADEYYATDGQFVRDSAYRSIQRGVIGRLPRGLEQKPKGDDGDGVSENSFEPIEGRAVVRGGVLQRCGNGSVGGNRLGRSPRRCSICDRGQGRSDGDAVPSHQLRKSRSYDS